MALLGLAPHRAQGRRRELALDVLHEVCAAFALPRALFLQQAAAVQNFVRRLCAANAVLFAATLYVHTTLVNSLLHQGRLTARSGLFFNAIRLELSSD